MNYFSKINAKIEFWHPPMAFWAILATISGLALISFSIGGLDQLADLIVGSQIQQFSDRLIPAPIMVTKGGIAFGPETFYRTRARSKFERVFSVLNPGDDYFIEVINGPEETWEETSSIIKINNETIFYPQDLKRGIGGFLRNRLITLDSPR